MGHAPSSLRESKRCARSTPPRIMRTNALAVCTSLLCTLRCDARSLPLAAERSSAATVLLNNTSSGGAFAS